MRGMICWLLVLTAGLFCLATPVLAADTVCLGCQITARTPLASVQSVPTDVGPPGSSFAAGSLTAMPPTGQTF